MSDQPEVSVDFAGLIGKAAGIDAGAAEFAEASAAGQIDQRGQIIAPDPDAAAMEWMFVGEILGFVAKAILPETAPAYTDDASMTLARAFVPVAEKYGWSGNHLAPELALAMAGFGFAMPALMAFRARKAAAAEQEGAEDGRRE